MLEGPHIEYNTTENLNGRNRICAMTQMSGALDDDIYDGSSFLLDVSHSGVGCERENIPVSGDEIVEFTEKMKI